MLQNNAGDDKTVMADGEFNFDVAVADGAGYEVTVLTQPDGQVCSVTDASGTISGAAVTDVSVVCEDFYTVGGTLSGIDGSVTLLNNAGDPIILSSTGNFTFSIGLADGEEYAVTVSSDPGTQTCVVNDGGGMILGGNITDITVSCTYDNNIMFLTQAGYQGDFATATDADAACMADVNKVDDSTYKALVVDEARVACTSANCGDGIAGQQDWVLQPDTTYYKSDAVTEVFTTNADGIFIFGTTESTIDGSYWSGLNSDWQHSNSHCSGWSNNTSGVAGANGISSFSNGWFIGFGVGTCDQAVSFMCVKQ
ncbi:MAG: DUF1554 domain-containing protein [bacterium]|nr:DUF1554 domain-containing protein [bacterium]